MTKKTFHLPEYIPYNTDELFFHKDELLFKKQLNSLFKQIFFLDLQKSFNNKNLISFEFETKQRQHSSKSKNPFEYNTISYYYEASIDHFKFNTINPSLNLDSEYILSTFHNYIENIEQKNLLAWITQIAMNNNIEHFITDDSKHFKITIDRTFLELMGKDAYKENYSAIKKEIFEETIPQNSHLSPKVKI